MDLKSDIKNRRKERIRLLLEDTSKESPLPPLYDLPEQNTTFKEWNQEPKKEISLDPEPDPELLWKQRRNNWEDDGDGGKPRFITGFLRRTVASILVFGAVWGIFAIQQPWAHKTQAFIVDALSHDMDFAAVRVWYEEHFDGAPAFIPIFGDKEQSAEKVSALHEWSAPLAGSIVQPFATTLKGVEIMPEEDSSGSVTVKSVDMGRVLSVSREAKGGIRVTLRHTGNVTAEYGHLSGTRLKADDWVQSGDAVGWIVDPGTTPETMFFFAMMKDKTYIDPSEVITFD
ncbi:peptidoglycan DD-metalloendopeptidase family protein [Paenibacillus sp. NPDC056722]|uniref:peptidoglycan DD-metalloendopeptidase family protein n=1 Tax=Paenibacillus sp. NPDC056722 TaxID=3345924 RepID=UPI00368726AF